MKILKEKSRVYNGQAYYKYKVNVPEVVLMRFKLKAGDELEVVPDTDHLTLRKKQSEDIK